MITRQLTLVPSLLVLALACGDDPEPMAMDGSSSSDGTGDATTVEGESETAADSSPEDGSTTAADASTSSDDADATDSGSSDSGDPTACAIDLLLVIDNSGSMGDEQGRLSLALPGFLADLENSGVSLHGMVVDVDAYPFAQCLDYCAAAERSGCLDDAGICSMENPDCQFTCTTLLSCGSLGYACGTEPAICEDVLGAGVIDPVGPGTPRGSCGFRGESRFVADDEPDYVDRLACASQVGTGSTEARERPMEAMLAAVSSLNRETAQCNAGFLREEAGLVVVFVTDENDDEEDGSAGTPASWRLGLLGAKGGDETRVVVTGIFGDNDQAEPVCPPLDDSTGLGAEPSPRSREFVESFGERGILGSVCADSYTEVLSLTAAAAAELCR